jgi:hypothetical protein
MRGDVKTFRYTYALCLFEPCDEHGFQFAALCRGWRHGTTSV